MIGILVEKQSQLTDHTCIMTEWVMEIAVVTSPACIDAVLCACTKIANKPLPFAV